MIVVGEKVFLQDQRSVTPIKKNKISILRTKRGTKMISILKYEELLEKVIKNHFDPHIQSLPSCYSFKGQSNQT